MPKEKGLTENKFRHTGSWFLKILLVELRIRMNSPTTSQTRMTQDLKYAPLETNSMALAVRHREHSIAHPTLHKVGSCTVYTTSFICPTRKLSAVYAVDQMKILGL